MSNILQISITTEGPTDNRFLPFIIQKTFENLALECNSYIEVYEPQEIEKITGPFIQSAIDLSKKYNYFQIMCIHCDADDNSEETVLKTKLTPVIDAIDTLEEDCCKNIVAIIPVYMTESWMLANPELLASRIDKSISLSDLGLPKIGRVETISDPKQTIIDAINVSERTGRRRSKKLSISQLYSPISKELELKDLRNLKSFQIFETRCREALIKLGYMTT